MSNLTAVSLFAGVGGFDLAMQRNGIEVVAAVEIDKNCREVLTKKFPKTKLFNDVKEVTGEQLKSAGFIPKRGIITGGFPCQDLSIAGLRKGLAGERSGLFHQIIRLVDELEPKFVILENVSGLLSSQSGRDMGIVITALVERGYGVCWRVLDSQNFGVPQRRRRIFIVASLGNHRQPVEILFESESSQWDFEALGKKRKRVTKSAETSARTFVKAKRAQTVNDNESWVEKETVPTLNEFDIGETRTTKAILFEPKSAFEENWSESKNKNALRANASKSSHAIVQPILFQGNRVGDPRFYDDGISPTVMSRWGTGGNNVPLMLSPGKEQANTINESIYHKQTVVNQDASNEHLVIQKSFTSSSFAQYKEGVGTLRANGGDLGGGSESIVVHNQDIVRRLTPRECERLQGFPDDWTDGQADSNRYKQLGNAVTVNVVDWIMKRLVNLVE
jgi:DNA (cytosine-5)-methyltransferase 1